ncbi:histidine kinase [Alteribacter lacisalsi]|uniref:histidine kinase n=1 Tax=Alteribacter lacisalsi TaxID=2045244 RepID=A0A2W0H6Z4_9BACI|nr:sensor histidine kinase [Alteribacter lacisalsi]PYZ96887.1 histidine kinase [Alteribacter lacisalsi]
MQTGNRFKDRAYIRNIPGKKIGLKLKIVILFSAVLAVMLVMTGLYFYTLLSDSNEQRIGEQALSVSETVALIPELREAFEEDDPSVTIQAIVEPIREASGAEFIVVGNKDEIRYSHPDPALLGDQMVGGDNERALESGESYISSAEGSLGYSIRGKVPVFADDGTVIGVVSTGFLMENVQGLIQDNRSELLFVLALVLGFGIVCAIALSAYIKKVLFDLEPEEISHLFLQKETILQSAHEGIIAVNRHGEMTLVNRAARRLFGSEEDEEIFIGLPVTSVLPDSKLPEVLETGKSQFNRQMTIGKNVVVVNRVPIYQEGRLTGAVSTFRNRTEIEQLTRELAEVKRYAEGLRAQTHEFSNKLYTILGHLQLGQKEEAIRYIKEEKHVQDEWIHLLIEKVADPMVSAILLGKMNLAREKHINLSIDPFSSLESILPEEQQGAIVTALGNIIHNAFEAVSTQPEEDRNVNVFFTDPGDSAVFEVEDSGPGVPAETAERLFNQGFSTKQGEKRGYGLALSCQVIRDLGGSVTLENPGETGACFVITLPKKGGEKHDGSI